MLQQYIITGRLAISSHPDCALRTAIQRELRHEVADVLGLCTGGVYWGISRFFDSPQPDAVVAKAVERDFPL